VNLSNNTEQRPKKLLPDDFIGDQVRETIRRKHYSIRTEKSYFVGSDFASFSKIDVVLRRWGGLGLLHLIFILYNKTSSNTAWVENMMNITLSNFESVIDHALVKRGRRYWQHGLVQDLEEIEDGKWTAQVEGTQVYEVSISISDDAVTDYNCTCPYDLGPVCKHEVAMLYAIQERLNGMATTDKGEQETTRGSRRRRAKTGKQKPKTVAKKVDEVLEKMSQEEIIDLVRSYALRNREFRVILLAQVTLRSGGDSKSAYRELIKESLRSGMDRHGFIDYWSTRRAVRGAEELLNKAVKLVESGNPEQAIPIFQAVIEELVPALQFADDSNGDIGGAIDWAFDEFYKCIEKIQDPIIRKDLFDYYLTEANRKQYEGWDWKWDFLRMASALISSGEQEKELFAKLDKISQAGQSSEFFDRYNQEQAAQIKLEVIRKRGRENDINQFINDNLHHTSIRCLAIEQAFSNKDFSGVIELAKQGIEQDAERQYPGLVNQWLNGLIKVAEKEENVEDIREYARLLFFETGNFEYYEKLKKTYSKSIWPDQVEKLLRHLQHVASFSTLAEISIREKEWQKLLDLVRGHTSFRTLETYHKYLAPHFTKELAEMYEKTSKELLAQSMGRAAYQDVCQMLRRMKKLGASDRVRQLIKEFSEQYKKRRALLEELERV
jgi:uncharacterized Zn finger protein